MRVVVGLCLIAALLGVGAPVVAQAEPTAVVTLGDSYASGEAGRWAGNSSSDYGDRRGTDRVAERRGWFWRYPQERVYGDSYANGCHRSDIAPIQSAGLNVDAVFNLACSGATTQNLLPASVGGAMYRGEAPQIDQLAAVAASHSVEVVVISIGGNDLGFSDVILDCVAGYVTSTRWAPNTCATDQGANVAAKLPTMVENLSRVLAETRSVLAANGDSGARLIVQGYPSPVAESGNTRYSQLGWQRTFRGGCPFWDSDLDWANGSLIPTITASLAETAAAAGAEFLDLSAALKGHEACAATASQGPGADGTGAEWIRFISTGLGQGDAEESAHPNAYGQQAMGRCIALAVERGGAVNRCVNSPGAGVSAMRLE